MKTEVLMTSFFQWAVVAIIATVVYFVVKSIAKKKLSDESSGFKGIRIVAIIILWTVILSPAYYEFADWGYSVPVTFDGNKIIEHPWGMFTKPIGAEFSNLPNDAMGGIKLIASTKIDKSRRQITNLYYFGFAKIISPEKYYTSNMYRREYGSNTVQNDLSYIAEKALCKFINENPCVFSDNEYNHLPVTYSRAESVLLSEIPAENKMAKIDSLKDVFDKWVSRFNYEETQGIKIALYRVGID